MTESADATDVHPYTTVERRAARLKDEAEAWAAGDAAFIALAGGPIRANRIYRRTQRGLSSPVTMHGVLIEPVQNGLWRVSRTGRHPLLLRAVEYHLVGKRRLLVVENELSALPPKTVAADPLFWMDQAIDLE
ncbi:hypothetical protein JKP75_02305 [Blastococcus sp. TML/M2B]|uniref:hypothetical protein n=1 Tax=unclassified Blastococcus TaxID=2619396 RepID=UPI00190C4BF2|nr:MULTISPECIES: hypothetical protein [unclassified Blastococcus]MBN1091513.1 hypothetical protein [Blastococcus sp. TML/M2B]MBN1094938.1 hypothetical protein [Blastococcus sp. TML/C7B]